MSETEKNQREQNRKRDTFIATSLVVVSFIFLVGTIVYKEIENKQLKKSQKTVKKSTFEDDDPCAPYINDKYWNFSGGCDQGRYIFSVRHGKKVYGSIEPLEWN